MVIEEYRKENPDLDHVPDYAIKNLTDYQLWCFRRAARAFIFELKKALL